MAQPSSDQADSAQVAELSVTFQPPLYEQRRAWVLDILRREKVTEVLDAGCGEGETLVCLCNPAPWRSPDSPDLPALSSDGAALDRQEDIKACVLREDFLHMRKLLAFDISPQILKQAVSITQPQAARGSWHGYTRWEPLEVRLWEGGIEAYNNAFVDIDCIVCTEVIEHLPEDILPEFAPMLLGVYHPRLLLITTPSYTFNARFTAPDAPPEARQGYPDPTGRTTRIFRHHDHKFEWTVQEFTDWCTGVAGEWGYDVKVSGVGKAREKDEWGRDDELGYASQVAAFTRKEGDDWVKTRKTRAEQIGIWTRSAARQQQKTVATHLHEAHDAAGKGNTSEEIERCVKSKLATWNTGAATIHELWFEDDVSAVCGGWLNVLLAVVEAQEDFALRRSGSRPLDWTLEWSGFVERIRPKAEEKVDVDVNGDGYQSLDEDLYDNWSEPLDTSWDGGMYDEGVQSVENDETSGWGEEQGENVSGSAWGVGNWEGDVNDTFQRDGALGDWGQSIATE